ncbi:MAG: transposase [Alphaproteobacteria bacterium]|nr:transposase [Alphaproteobacteria bacterium]
MRKSGRLPGRALAPGTRAACYPRPYPPPDHRQQQRQLQSEPVAETLAAWAEQTVRQLLRESKLVQVFRYIRARWPALVGC